MQGRFPGTFRALPTCRGERLPDRATYRRVILSDATPCPKTGAFQPSINLSADHETGLAEPKQTQNRPKENPRNPDPTEPRPHGTPTPRNPGPTVARPRGSPAAWKADPTQPRAPGALPRFAPVSNPGNPAQPRGVLPLEPEERWIYHGVHGSG
jgi:hypothetical protein